MFCPKCGKEITTRICYNCGFDTGNSEPVQQPQPQVYASSIRQDDGFLSESRLANKNGLGAIISTKDWFTTFGIAFLINLIPFVGPLGSIIYYIVLLCRKETAASIRSYIKCQLIISCIIFAITVLLVIIFLSIIGAWIGKALILPNTTTKVSSLFNYTA